MNEQQLAAVKQALEALESERDKYLEWGDEDGAPEDVYEAITALQSIISQDALYKMAEESRTSGLRLDDWDKIGCVNHDCDKCKAVQEPVAQDVQEKCRIEDVPAKGGLVPTPPAAQPAPVQDAEGENKAVRFFLMLYGQPGLTVGQMKGHMRMSGFKMWPAWVDTEPDGAHLTKAGAQLWIRHLFALEPTTPQPVSVQEPVARYCCQSCFKASGGVMLDRMILCPECGNKRCPKASDHNFSCTGSNEPGQWGSIYTNPPAARPAPVQECESCKRKDCLLEMSLATIQNLQGISDEYNAWIKHHAAGHDYDDFLKTRAAAPEKGNTP